MQFSSSSLIKLKAKMKTLLDITIIVILLFVDHSFQQLDEKVNLALYYEPLCPGSRQFIDEELASTYPNISSILNVTFNPYGNTERTKVDNHWQFDCQHGVSECKLAIITACSLQKLDQSRHVEFVNCLSRLSVAEECVTNAHLNYTDILSCANNDLGEELFAKYGKELDTLDPLPKSVPHIVFNGVFLKNFQNSARENLLATVCLIVQIKSKTNIKPDACRNVVLI